MLYCAYSGLQAILCMEAFIKLILPYDNTAISQSQVYLSQWTGQWRNNVMSIVLSKLANVAIDYKANDQICNLSSGIRNNAVLLP